MNRFVLAPTIFMLLVVVFGVGLLRDPSVLPSPLLGKPMPEFELPELTDLTVRVRGKDLVGRYAIINIWGSWCSACRREHDFLMKISDDGVVPVYGLNWRDERSRALKWLDELGDPYTANAFDSDGQVGIEFGAYGAPETFLLSPDGEILHKHISPLTPDVWENDFLRRIREHSRL